PRSEQPRFRHLPTSSSPSGCRRHRDPFGATSLHSLGALSVRHKFFKMPRATSDAKLLIQSLHKAYASTPTNLKIIDLYVICAVAAALIQVAYMGLVGSFPFNSFLSGVLSCIGTAVLAAVFYFTVCLRIQVNKDNKEFKDLAPERAFADFVLCNLVLHLVIMNFLG
ncbi:unnamed protein product, partial [Urochloa humidicola]